MLISVIIPVFNAEKYIEKAVTSALAQEETGEIILAEDGSEDNSLEICEHLSQKFKKVHLYTHPENKNFGPAKTRNLGLSHAKYKYISFLDADDYYLEDRFKVPLAILEGDKTIDGVYGYMKNVPLNENVNMQKHNEIIGLRENVTPEDLFYYVIRDDKPYFSIISLLIRKSLIDKAGLFDETLLYSEDIDFTYRLALNGNLVSDGLNEARIIRLVHGENMTHNASYDPGHYRMLVSKKWYRIMLKEGFDKRSNRTILRRYLNVLFYEKGYDAKSVTRYFFKLTLFLKTLINDKILLKRIF